MVPLVNPQIARRNSLTRPSWWQGPVRWIVAVLALLAFADALYLTWVSLSHSTVAGCDGTGFFNCDRVLQSSWSRFLFIPVALGGAVCYAAVFTLGLLAGRRGDETDHWLSTAFVAAALLAAGAGLWFTLVQFVSIGTFCRECMATHLCGLAIAGLVLWKVFRQPRGSLVASQSHVALAAIPGAPGVRRAAAPRTALGPSLPKAGAAAGAMLALLIVVQFLFPAKTFEASKPQLSETIDLSAAADRPRTGNDSLSPTAQEHVVNRVSAADDGQVAPTEDADEPASDVLAASVDSDESSSSTESAPAVPEPTRSREVTFLDGKMRINMYEEAVLGSPEAPYVIAELMDYTCPHCRELHKKIRRAKERYGDQLAVVIMPVPLELECNKIVPATNPEHRGACSIAQRALAVGKISPTAFIEFHNWLLANEEQVPSAASTVRKAFRLVDRSKLTSLSSSDEIRGRIEKYVNLYSRLSSQYHTAEKPFGLPVMIVGDTVLTGKIETVDDLCEAWEKAIDIKPL